MSERFIRAELMLGREKVNSLKDKHVMIFGVGGVGGNVCEALARIGIGKLTIIDDDTVSESNINRQIIALSSTVGKNKVDVMKERMLDINPELEVVTLKKFFLPDNANEFDFENVDYIVDAIDTVAGKLKLIEIANEKNIPIISSMGTGNKVDPTKLEISDIYKTSVCPLAKVMRKELKARRIKKCKVLFSKELPLEVDKEIEKECMKPDEKRRSIPGSVSFVPPAAGLIIACEVVKDLLK